jgi:hypothetical protein
MSSRSALFLGALVLLLLAAGCGSGSKTSSSSTTRGSVADTATAPSPPRTTSSIPANNGAATAFLPAYFTLGADDSLNPPTIAGPVATTILVTVTSHASHPAQVTVASHSLSVQPGGHASTRIAPLKAGHYAVDVDGKQRATLIVGAQPGP